MDRALQLTFIGSRLSTEYLRKKYFVAGALSLSRSKTQYRSHVPLSLFLVSLFLLGAQVFAQAIGAGPSASGGRSASAITNGAGPAGIIPFTHGFNISLGATSQHNSSSGWSSIVTPGVAYRFNRAFSLNASVPVYAAIQVQANTGTKAKPVYTATTEHGVPGDASVAAQFDTHSSLLDYNGTLTLGLPSGNTAYGLGAGKITGDFNNHIEKSLGIFTPDIEFGVGSSSSLIAARVRKSYTATGPLAHFQAGTSIDLPLNMSFEADAYEEFPLNASTIYSVTGRGRKKGSTTTSSAEDNGFTTSLDVPLGSHITLSAFFNRSVRTSENIAGFSVTFLAKAAPKESDAVQ